MDVDLVFSEGAPVYGAITDNWPTIEPYFNETGSNCPSVLPRSQQASMLFAAFLPVLYAACCCCQQLAPRCGFACWRL